MTKTICTIFLHAATLRLSYRSIKSLRRRHHHHHHHKNHHHHHDSNDNDHHDPSILKLWSLIAIHAVYTQTGIEFIISFIPFYYYIKLLAMITLHLNVDGVFHLLVKGIDTLHYILEDVTFYTRHLCRKVGECVMRWRDESVMVVTDLPRRGVYVCWNVLVSDEEEWERVYQVRTRQIEEVRSRNPGYSRSRGFDDDKGVVEVDDDGLCRQDESSGDSRDVDETVDPGMIVEDTERDDSKEDENINDDMQGGVVEVDDDGVCRQDESSGDSRDVDETVNNGVSVEDTERDDVKEQEKIINNMNRESDKEEHKGEIIPSNMKTVYMTSCITEQTTEAPQKTHINSSKGHKGDNSGDIDETVDEMGVSMEKTDRDDAREDDEINENIQGERNKEEKKVDDVISSNIETANQKSLIAKQTTATTPEKKSINFSSNKSLQKAGLLELTKSCDISSNNEHFNSMTQSLQTLYISSSSSSVDELSLSSSSPSQKTSSTKTMKTTTTTPSTDGSGCTTNTVTTTTTTNPSNSSSTYQKTTTSQKSKTIPQSSKHDTLSISTHSNISTTITTTCDDFSLTTPLSLPKKKKKSLKTINYSRLSSVFSPVAQSRVMASALNLRRFQKTHSPSSVVRQPLLSLSTTKNDDADDDDDDKSVASTLKSYITGSSRIRMRDYLFDLDLPVSYNKLTTTAHHAATTSSLSMAQRPMASTTTTATVAKNGTRGNSNEVVVNTKQQKSSGSSGNRFLRRVTFKNR